MPEHVEQDFPLNKGWALKENLKLAGNLRAEDQYSPKDMHTSLENLVIEGELTLEEISTVKTIKGWIERYSTYFKKEVSEKALLKNNTENVTVAESSSQQRPYKLQKKI
ncbi:hypothetical protein GLOIN_2v1485655 [Rhizophagus clarus]|uniref:Uncharacterized protein n=1 Tax=Rhizophagus clarus TaxID=94130 RepID=A0A8H3L0F1_9GLOM|nr:hypothetical protein GLOIN_2v1485655 [Rhizophagus clarus]